MSKTIVCSTTQLYHYLFNPKEDALDSFYEIGIRPLSDFPDSDRWKQLEAQMPGFYRDLYAMMAEPVLKKPYQNSGIFITPIDFRLVPGTYLYDKPRFKIPVERIDPEYAVLTYVLDDQRVVARFTAEARQTTAVVWDAEMVKQWFAVDPTKSFFYVPQVACYQGVIKVSSSDLEQEVG